MGNIEARDARDAPAVPAHRPLQGPGRTEIGWRYDLGRSTGGRWHGARGGSIGFRASAHRRCRHRRTALMPARMRRFLGLGRSPESTSTRTEPERDAAETVGPATGARTRRCGAALAMLTTTFWISGSWITDRHIAGRGPAGASARVSRWPASRFRMLVTHPRFRRTGLSNGQVCTEIGWRNDLRRSTGDGGTEHVAGSSGSELQRTGDVATDAQP